MRGDTRATVHTYYHHTRRHLHICGTQKSTADDNTPHTIYNEHTPPPSQVFKKIPKEKTTFSMYIQTTSEPLSNYGYRQIRSLRSIQLFLSFLYLLILFSKIKKIVVLEAPTLNFFK